MTFELDIAWVVWPEYFDVQRSRSAGRRVKKELAIENPTLENITRALDRLEWDYYVQEDKAHPSHWWRPQGRVLVENSMPKTELIGQIANNLPRD